MSETLSNIQRRIHANISLPIDGPLRTAFLLWGDRRQVISYFHERVCDCECEQKFMPDVGQKSRAFDWNALSPRDIVLHRWIVILLATINFMDARLKTSGKNAGVLRNILVKMRWVMYAFICKLSLRCFMLTIGFGSCEGGFIRREMGENCLISF